MTLDEPRRPDPDALLLEAAKAGRGRLKVFLGMAPGVGKTFEMLAQAARRKAEGATWSVGVVETHGRKETEALTAGPRDPAAQADRLPRPHADGVRHRRGAGAQAASCCWSTSSPTPTPPARATRSAGRTSRS